MPPALGLADISQMDGAHPRFWAWIPPSWPQGKEFPHSGWGREGFDARHGGPGRLRAAFGLTTAPRGRTPGAARPPAACRCPFERQHGTGSGSRSLAIRSRRWPNSSRGTATSAIWKIAYRQWAITFAPILTTFSRSVVRDHRSISPGRARVRRKLARL